MFYRHFTQFRPSPKLNIKSRYWLIHTHSWFSSTASKFEISHSWKANKPSEPSTRCCSFPVSSFGGFHWGFPHYLWVIHILIVAYTAGKNTLAVVQTLLSRNREKSKMKTRFPFRLDNAPHSHVSVSLCVIRHPSGLKTSSLSLQATLPNTASPLIFTKNWKTAAFCISSPLCDGVIGLSVLLAAFSFFFFSLTVRQLHPAGCVVGVPSVVWELCLQDAALPGGFYTL